MTLYCVSEVHLDSYFNVKHIDFNLHVFLMCRKVHTYILLSTLWTVSIVFGKANTFVSKERLNSIIKINIFVIY